MKSEESIKSLEILLNENLIWKEHLKNNENKFAKNIGFLYKAKPHLIKKCLIALCHSLIHAYINYAYIAWYSNLKNVNLEDQ